VLEEQEESEQVSVFVRPFYTNSYLPSYFTTCITSASGQKQTPGGEGAAQAQAAGGGGGGV
jgi:hypothetical protein